MGEQDLVMTLTLYPVIVCAERPLSLSSTFLRSGAMLHRASSSGVDHCVLVTKERDKISRRQKVQGLFVQRKWVFYADIVHVIYTFSD